MKRRNVHIVLLIAGLTWIHQTPVEAAGFKRQTIQNKTGGDVNDLTLKLDPKSGNNKAFKSKPKIWHSGLDDGDGINEKGERKTSVLSTDKETATFAQNTFGTIADNGFADIDFEPDGNANIDEAASTWTLNGAPVAGPKVVAKPMQISFNTTTGEATALFSNPGSTAVTYTNIELFKNNALSGYTLDDFVEATGTQVAVQSSISLGAGGSMSLSFGVVDLEGSFQLARADVIEDANPGDVFSVAAAASVTNVPTVSGWGLSALALLVLTMGTVIVLRRAKAPTA